MSAPMVPLLVARAACAGTLMVKEPKVLAIFIGPPERAVKVDPPSVDFATRRVCPPASGQKTKTSPKELVLISPPSAVEVVSLPLTWMGVPHEPEGPLRAETKHCALRCQTAYILSRKEEVAEWSTQRV